MKKNNKTKAKKSSTKITIEGTKEKLTTQAGLVSAIKFLDKIGLSSVIEGTVEHIRGANADYKISDAIYLTILGLIGGARYISGVITVWSDRE